MIHHINNERQAMNPEESATDRELDQFYGTPPTEAQVQESIRRHKELFDEYDLMDICASNKTSILGYLEIGDFAAVGYEFDVCRRNEIAQNVSVELYGKRGVITAKDIK